jgi:hypothetical protein
MKNYIFLKKRLSGAIFGFLVIATFCLIFGPGIASALTRVGSEVGYIYGYGTNGSYGYGYGSTGNVTSISSSIYTVSTITDTITDVEYLTPKTTFLASLTKGEANQRWITTDVTDPVTTGDTLTVVSEDGTASEIYDITVNAAGTTAVVTGGTSGAGGSWNPPASLAIPVQVTTPETASTPSAGTASLEAMASEATIISDASTASVIAEVGATANPTLESQNLAKVISVLGTASTALRGEINNFVTYGTPTTLTLGSGERLGVVNSYKSAFGKLPDASAQWNDVIKIANGRWPSETSATAESKAKATFKTIYKRNANMANAHDNAAVTVMAYGLRPANRNLNSERAAIKSYRAIFGINPSLSTAWDAVRAISYSGATR